MCASISDGELPLRILLDATNRVVLIAIDAKPLFDASARKVSM
jgi:hypothetical protein